MYSNSGDVGAFKSRYGSTATSQEEKEIMQFFLTQDRIQNIVRVLDKTRFFNAMRRNCKSNVSIDDVHTIS